MTKNVRIEQYFIRLLDGFNHNIKLLLLLCLISSNQMFTIDKKKWLV